MTAPTNDTPSVDDSGMQFRDRLRLLREMSGLTQSGLARRAGCQPSNIAHMEAGRREPNFANIVKLVRALGVSADVLLGTARQ